MTYGWAILSAIIVIGALGSYFYFNQNGSSTIYVNAPFYGVASNAAPGVVNLEIANKGGENLNNITIGVTGCVTNTTGFNGSMQTPQIIRLACSGATSGSSFKGSIVVTYLRPDSALPLTSTGSVSTPVA